MKALTVRRTRNTVIVVAISLGAGLAFAASSASLGPAQLTTGWVLFGIVVLLALLSMRKRLSFLQLGSARNWLQFHIYAGWFCVALFVVHLGGRLPNGAVEISLSLLFVIVAGSGIVGLILSRTIPRRLSTRGQEVIYERIPVLLRTIREDVERQMLASVSETKSTSISDFYTGRLAAYFQRPRHFWRHLAESRGPLQKILDEIQAMERYLSPREREFMDLIGRRVREKDDLDYHYAGQAMLKRWLFVHIPLTSALLMFGLLHALLIHAFQGGIR